MAEEGECVIGKYFFPSFIDFSQSPGSGETLMMEVCCFILICGKV